MTRWLVWILNFFFGYRMRINIISGLVKPGDLDIHHSKVFSSENFSLLKLVRKIEIRGDTRSQSRSINVALIITFSFCLVYSDLSIYLSIYFSIYLSIYLCIYLYIYPSIYLSIYLGLLMDELSLWVIMNPCLLPSWSMITGKLNILILNEKKK